MNLTRTVAAFVAGAAGTGLCLSLTPFKDSTKSVHAEPNLNVLTMRNFVLSEFKTKYDTAIEKSREILNRFKDEHGAPGVVIGVSVNGRVVWEEGIGYADLENRTPCHTRTAMRIASISKPITMALLAKMWENNEIDIDKPVQEYVPYFPKKEVDGQNVTITTRQLASHTSGIRHYERKNKEKNEKEKDGKKKSDDKSEFYLTKKFSNLQKSLDLFKDDELFFKPGTSYLYSTHGYTLLSAVVEGAAKKDFKAVIQNLFYRLGLKNTTLDEVNTIIYNRSRYYTKDKNGKLINCDLADSSYKWAGGGLISTVQDLLKFGNLMLYCYQQDEKDKPGYLKKETVQRLWTPVEHAVMPSSLNTEVRYGLGWKIIPSNDSIESTEGSRLYVGHGGGAVGASSFLLIASDKNSNDNEIKQTKPLGVTVAILTNLESVGCLKTAKEIAELFIES